jgi:hypothetical protein
MTTLAAGEQNRAAGLGNMNARTDPVYVIVCLDDHADHTSTIRDMSPSEKRRLLQDLGRNLA